MVKISVKLREPRLTTPNLLIKNARAICYKWFWPAVNLKRSHKSLLWYATKPHAKYHLNLKYTRILWFDWQSLICVAVRKKKSATSPIISHRKFGFFVFLQFKKKQCQTVYNIICYSTYNVHLCKTNQTRCTDFVILKLRLI